MRGLKRDRSARVMIAGHAFILVFRTFEGEGGALAG